MRRRAFIAALGGAAAWPFVARAQQPAKLPTIGFLGSGTPTAQGLWLAAFVQRLHELGWIEGRNLAIEYRWAEGSSDRAAQSMITIDRDDFTGHSLGDLFEFQPLVLSCLACG